MASVRILSGTYKNQVIVFSPTQALRPTSHRLRQAAFNILLHRFYAHTMGQSHPLQNLRVLDLFAGVGSYGLEALSLGASHATFLESSHSSIRTLHKTIQTLGCEAHARFLCRFWPDSTPFTGETFDLLFLDPPYDISSHDRTLALEACAPLMTSNSLLVLESASNCPACPSLHKLYEKKSTQAWLTFFQIHHSVP